MTGTIFAQAYDEHFKGTLRFLLAKGASQELAEDICQSAWVRAWEKREQWKGTSSFKSWVNTIAWNIFLSNKRKRPIEQFPEHFDSPIAPVDRHIEMDAERVLMLCTPVERKLLTARYLKDLTGEEAAAVIRINHNTLKTRVSRLAHKLRAKLAAPICKRKRRKIPMDGNLLRNLYISRKLTTTQIANMFGCATHKSVCRALKKFNIPMRPRHHVSDGKCKECGAPAVRKKSGAALSRLCRVHQTAYQTEWARKVRARDPEVGCRPLGRKHKPRPCPRCGLECKGTRAANMHCPSQLRQERSRRGWITRKQRLGVAHYGS